MATYSGRRVVLYCVGTCFLTVGSLAIFRATLWPRLKSELGLDRPGWARPIAPADEASLRMAHARYEQVLAKRESLVGVEDQARMMKLFFDLDIYKNMWWLGIPVMKTPGDMWMMQQLISEIRPDYVIEAGTFFGGSALFYAHILDGLYLPDARVITIDIEDHTQEASKSALWQKRVEFVLGSSTDPEIVSRINTRVSGKKVIVDLDSDHHRDHVLRELIAYSPMVPRGSYIIVEDTALDGIPLTKGLGPGPMAAVKEFLESGKGGSFAPDSARESLLISFHPGGWLRRIE